MRRILTIVATLAMGVALGGMLSQVSPAARIMLAWTASPTFEKTVSTRVEPDHGEGCIHAFEKQG